MHSLYLHVQSTLQYVYLLTGIKSAVPQYNVRVAINTSLEPTYTSCIQAVRQEEHWCVRHGWQQWREAACMRAQERARRVAAEEMHRRMLLHGAVNRWRARTQHVQTRYSTETSSWHTQSYMGNRVLELPGLLGG